MDKSETIIEVNDLDIGYDNRTVLENINFKVNKGEILFILGNSGCGKSTLLKHLIGLYQPIRGDIKLRDKASSTPRKQKKKSCARGSE